MLLSLLLLIFFFYIYTGQVQEEITSCQHCKWPNGNSRHDPNSVCLYSTWNTHPRRWHSAKRGRRSLNTKEDGTRLKQGKNRQQDNNSHSRLFCGWKSSDGWLRLDGHYPAFTHPCTRDNGCEKTELLRRPVVKSKFPWLFRGSKSLIDGHLPKYSVKQTYYFIFASE